MYSTAIPAASNASCSEVVERAVTGDVARRAQRPADGEHALGASPADAHRARLAASARVRAEAARPSAAWSLRSGRPAAPHATSGQRGQAAARLCARRRARPGRRDRGWPRSDGAASHRPGSPSRRSAGRSVRSCRTGTVSQRRPAAVLSCTRAKKLRLVLSELHVVVEDEDVGGLHEREEPAPGQIAGLVDRDDHGVSRKYAMTSTSTAPSGRTS